MRPVFVDSTLGFGMGTVNPGNLGSGTSPSRVLGPYSANDRTTDEDVRVLLIGSGSVATAATRRLEASGCVVLRGPLTSAMPTVRAIYCCTDSAEAIHSGPTVAALRAAVLEARRHFRELLPLVVVEGHVVVGTTDWLRHVLDRLASVAYIAAHADVRHGGPVIGAAEPAIAERVANLECGEGRYTHLSCRGAEMVDCTRRTIRAAERQVLHEFTLLVSRGGVQPGNGSNANGSDTLGAWRNPPNHPPDPSLCASLAQLANLDTPVLAALAAQSRQPRAELPHAAIGRAYLAGLDAAMADAAGPSTTRGVGPSWWYPAAKRAIDIVVASLSLVAASPLLLIVATLIMIESGRPVLFSFPRVGRGGQPFRMLKFRSLSSTAPPTANKSEAEAYATRVGRVIRATAIDELPQLINVLKGDMSLVGPRPEQPFITDWYQPWQRERHLVRPGMTGWWQINWRGKEREMYRRVDYDIWYVRNRSLLLDLRIIWRTPAALYAGMTDMLGSRPAGASRRLHSVKKILRRGLASAEHGESTPRQPSPRGEPSAPDE